MTFRALSSEDERWKMSNVRDAISKSPPPRTRDCGLARTDAARIRYLYDHRAVAAATFAGSPLAGFVLIAVNYYRLAKPVAAAAAVLVGVVLTAILLHTAFGQSSVASVKIAPVSLLTTVLAAKVTQRRLIERQISQGARAGSMRSAFAIGLATLAVIAGITLALD